MKKSIFILGILSIILLILICCRNKLDISFEEDSDTVNTGNFDYGFTITKTIDGSTETIDLLDRLYEIDRLDGLYEINGSWHNDDIIGYTLSPIDKYNEIEFDDGSTFVGELSLSQGDYEWIENGLYDFKYLIYLNLKFSGGQVIDWSLVDKKTMEELGKLNIDELNKLYTFEVKYRDKDFETKYPVKEMEVNKEINLSELDENVIYKCIFMAKDENLPGIINDLDFKVIVYRKNAYQYEPKLYTEDQHEGGDKIRFNSCYGKECTTVAYIMYKKVQ